jgi:hypothetical protein
VRVANQPEGEIGGAFAELLRLQTEFHAQLADDTLKYLRRLQGAGMPTAPGTVLMPGGLSDLRTSGSAGNSAELKFEIENRQRVYCMVTPMLSPLVETSGVTWFPAVEPSSATILLAPEEIAPVVIGLLLPTDIPSGVYRGALLLEGFRAGAIAVTVEVTSETNPKAATRKQSSAKTTKAKTNKRDSSTRLSAKKSAAPKARKGRRASAKQA